jgi:hypothetical protein
MKYLLFYQMTPDGDSRIPVSHAGHKARLQEFRDKGTLLMAGPFGSPPIGAVSIFTTREAALEFISGDPFVTNRVVQNLDIHEWNEVLVP